MQPGSQPFTGRTHRHSPSSLHLRSGQMAAVGPPMSECCNGESGCPTLTLWVLRQTMPQHGRRESALRPKCTVGAQLGEQSVTPPSIPLRVTASTASDGCGCKRRSRSGRYLKETCTLGSPSSHEMRAPGRTRNPNLLICPSHQWTPRKCVGELTDTIRKELLNRRLVAKQNLSPNTSRFKNTPVLSKLSPPLNNSTTAGKGERVDDLCFEKTNPVVDGEMSLLLAQSTGC